MFMKKLGYLLLLSCLASCLVMEDASACLRRRSRPCCYRSESYAGGVSIEKCATDCKSANGSLGPNTTFLRQCYVVDSNHNVHQGTVTYGYGSWSATFDESPVPPCTCTIVGGDNSADSKACTGYGRGCGCNTCGVTIDWCDLRSAFGRLRHACCLRDCYVVDKNGKLYECDFHCVGHRWWEATCKGSPAGPCTWTVVGDDGSAAARYYPCENGTSGGE